MEKRKNELRILKNIADQYYEVELAITLDRFF